MKIEEVIVVEGRDDTLALRRAVDCFTIETHGFGIKKETWNLIEKAYNEKGIIIFTDPDYIGEEIRRRISKRFPDAKHAYLSREDAKKGRDIGVENANPNHIIASLEQAKAKLSDKENLFSESDIYKARLTGYADSKERRQQLGKILGIGYGNAKSLLKKLNAFNIDRKEFESAIEQIDNLIDN